jgi:nucleotide-binding universal stress UspA family protein
VLVGVDGSTQNASAVAWAAAEVSSSPGDPPLVLVHGSEGPQEPSSIGRAILERALTDVTRQAPGLTPVAEVRHGGVQAALRAAATTWSDPLLTSLPALLVLGRRGHGPSRPVRLGMTARRLVHEAGPAVVVVPEAWRPGAAPAEAPVVVDLGEDEEEGMRTLGVAMDRAARDGRRVLAVLVWTPLPGSPDHSISEVWAEHADRAERALGRLLQPWREAYPEVELTGTTTDRHAVSALLDHAGGAELLVVPRGDRACAVVEYAECPVAVV